LWDVGPGRSGVISAPLATLGGPKGPVWSVAFSPRVPVLAAGYEDGTILLLDVEIRRKYPTLTSHTKNRIVSLPCTTDGSRLYSAGYDGIARAWDVEQGNQLLTLVGHAGAVTAVALSPDGRHAVTSSFDGTLKTWDTTTGKEEQTLRGHN